VAWAISVTAARSWVDGQLRTVGVLSTVARMRALEWAVRLAATEPRVAEEVVAGVPTSVVRPGRGECWPVFVFVNGVTARGRHHPDVQRLARGLAGAGFLVLVPDLPGLAVGEITAATVAKAGEAARAAADRPDARGGRVGLLGVSIGATLALLAAEKADIAERVTVVAGIAPYTDHANAIRLATTGHALDRGRLVPYTVTTFLGLVIARSMVGALPPSRDRDRLLTQLRQLPDDTPDPLAVFRLRQPEQFEPSARALVALLANRDPLRFEQLDTALPREVRDGIALLSPLHGAERLRAPVEIASAPHDRYFPLSETRALAQVATRTRVRLTVTSALQHADLRLSLSEIADLARLDGWIVRVLQAARRP